jgi:hypothetical protein
MEKIQELIKRPLITGLIGFIIGLIIGLPVLGWGLMPVQWKDADPSYLRDDIKDDYFCMVVNNYLKTGGLEVAKSRLEQLGEVSETKLNSLLPGDCGLTSGEIDQFKTALGAASAPSPAVTETAVVNEEEESASGVKPTVLLGILCLVTLIIGGVLAYIFFFNNRKIGGSTTSRTIFSKQSAVEPPETSKMNFEEMGQEAPIAQFMSTYVTGDDLYDDSFSIDSPSGEFMGECGVGISETIGVGDPKKITAFEVWLFDKNDIQTVTKVLMSQHAFDDPAISQRLASKGEPVLLQPGGRVLLETATLQLEARVVDMNYGQGALPENSFIDRITLELAVWPKA